MKRSIFGWLALLASLWIALPAYALPTFQVYIDGAVAGQEGGDEDTWISSDNPLTLVVVGAYRPTATVSLTELTLVLTVPEGEAGTITFTAIDDGVPTLLTSEGLVPLVNPSGDANEDLLADVVGLDGYDMKADFEPDGLTLDNHFPSKDGMSDFILYALGDFDNVESNLYDYNADNGTITETMTGGDERRYSLTITGFTSVHFDMYGLETTQSSTKVKTSWDDNPNSHDAAWYGNGDEPGQIEIIPEPSSLSLLGVGLLGFMRRRRNRPA